MGRVILSQTYLTSHKLLSTATQYSVYLLVIQFITRQLNLCDIERYLVRMDVEGSRRGLFKGLHMNLPEKAEEN